MWPSPNLQERLDLEKFICCLNIFGRSALLSWYHCIIIMIPNQKFYDKNFCNRTILFLLISSAIITLSFWIVFFDILTFGSMWYIFESHMTHLEIFHFYLVDYVWEVLLIVSEILVIAKVFLVRQWMSSVNVTSCLTFTSC